MLSGKLQGLLIYEGRRSVLERKLKMSADSVENTQVNYSALDEVKRRCIEAGKQTLSFAGDLGGVLSNALGASSNLFAIDIGRFAAMGLDKLLVTLLPEGLGTADDARPEDLSEDEQVEFWHNIAFKTVSTLTNDAVTSGAQTLLLSLYLPSGDPERVFTGAFCDGFLSGIVEACREVGCVYFSGETPQLRSKIFPDRLDIAGAVFGMIPPGGRAVDGAQLGAGDSMVFLASSGPHENGFTPLRALAEKLPQGYRTELSDEARSSAELGPVGDDAAAVGGVRQCYAAQQHSAGKRLQYWQGINAASVLYTPVVQRFLKEGLSVTNIENITGHGWQKIMRSGKPLRYVISNKVELPPIFKFIQHHSGSSLEEMLRVFNCGVGMVVFLRNREDVARALELASQHGVRAWYGGRVEAAAEREVFLKEEGISLKGADFALVKA